MNTKTPISPKYMIEFRQVSFHINDILHRLIVLGVSLEIPQGETLVLLGRSGSGKTTLLKLINGMLLPSKGEFLANGRPPAAWILILPRRAIGYLFRTAASSPISLSRKTSGSFR